MIRIHPAIETKIRCNVCNQEFPATSFHLTGVHVLGSGVCPTCKLDELFMEMPTSAGLIYPTIIRKSDGKRVDDMPFTNWFIESLKKSFANRRNDKIEICKIVNSKEKKEKILILNTIDSTYGHSLMNIFNLSYYRKKEDYHLVLLVQKNLLWLVPDNLDEVWVADISFSKAENWNDYLAIEVNNKLKEYQEGFLCKSLPQSPDDEFQIEEYTRVKPFPLEEWDSRLTKPTITFIWRTDRFWKRSLSRWFDNRISRRLAPSKVQNLKNKIQFNWILKFAEELRRKAPSVDFAIAGMDSRDHALPAWIQDLRFPAHDDNNARELCKRYAKSHLIIGCNGSSLVLPSCHAGAVMNIVPNEGLAVSVGSFYFRQTSIADTFYRYSLLPAETSIERMVKVAIQILRDRSMIQLISGSPWNDHEAKKSPEEWAKFRKQIFNNTSYFEEREGLISISE
jgi:hypothetical protein